MKGDLIAIVESAYAVDRPRDAWLDGVVEAAAACLDDGLGVWAALYDASRPDDFRFEVMRQRGLKAEHAELLTMAAPTVTQQNVEMTFQSGKSCATLSEILPPSFFEENAIAVGVRERFGIVDALGINASDPTHRGLAIGVPLTRKSAASPAQKRRWARISAHLAAAHRLRVKLEQRAEALLDSAEAVLDEDGTVKHARDEATLAGARAALRGAAVALDKARARRLRAEPDAALETWRGLISGRWSLVDHFDRDGRRYVVAQRNDPQVDPQGLTLRERQVVAYAAMGHSNKLIGYELGLSPTTVATHLMNAASKLGTKSRAELIRSHLTRAGSGT